MSREVGAESIGILRALAKQVDPTGIMNPGKLLPD
jgi:FAD/FMN-containing dehydrogenase